MNAFLPQRVHGRGGTLGQDLVLIDACAVHISDQKR
jgi:hypothetical protein